MHVALRPLSRLNNYCKLIKTRFQNWCVSFNRLNMSESKSESKQEPETTQVKDEQVVNIETVIATDNKGIDYDKLISKLKLFISWQLTVGMWVKGGLSAITGDWLDSEVVTSLNLSLTQAFLM